MSQRLKLHQMCRIDGTSKLVPFLPQGREWLRKRTTSVVPNGHLSGLRIQAPKTTFAFPAKGHEFIRAVSKFVQMRL
jgi:hypothetical protein